MSVCASIDIRIYSEKICRLTIVNCFLNDEWNIEYEDKVYYLPFGDIDDFNWCIDKISKEDLLSIFEKKEKKES